MSLSRSARSAQALRQAAPLFAALGDQTRLQVMARLCAEGPLSITRITEGCAVSRQAVTKHLRVLEEADLVRGSRDGRESVWTLQPAQLDQARRTLDLISQRWDQALARLQDLVER
jgi:DNA-binding transcriptional ArsR family regulator